MRVMVIGLGSMGRRRTRLIKQYDKKIEIIGVDSQESRRLQFIKELECEAFSCIDEALHNGVVDAAFVCTSPLSHSKIINECLGKNMHIFSEINLVSDMYDENMELSKNMKKVLFLSSTPMYRREMQWIKKKVIAAGTKLSYQYHVGNYLPDWHPWESYKNFFVGDKRTNGCREFMAIEFPWLLDTFGDVDGICAFSTKTTNLELDYDDTVHIMLKHNNGSIGSIQIDVASRNAVREFECLGENLFIQWKGNPDELYEYIIADKQNVKIDLYRQIEHLDGYNNTIIEDAYFDEIVEFFECINQNKKAKHSFENDKRVLGIINQIEGEISYD